MHFNRGPQVKIGVVAAVAAAIVWMPGFVRAADFPPAKSAEAVKELATVLEAKKLETFAANDGGDSYKFVAVLYAKGVQMLAVSATYERAGDIDYYIQHKDYGSAFADLRASIYSKDKFMIEDLECNGLVPQPKKPAPQDTVTTNGQHHVLDGIFADPRHADPKKMAFDAYTKLYTDADDQYTRILTVALAAAKKID